MTYLITYLCVGLVTVLTLYISSRISTEQESTITRDLKDILHPERKTWRYRLLNNVVAPALATILVTVAWPFAIYMTIKQMLSSQKTASTPEKKAFSVVKTDLLEMLSTEQIERREYVIDPMGAVPPLPFGHLNGAWTTFKSGLEPDHSISSFSAQWTTDWGRKEIREGYAAVRGDDVGPHFITGVRRLIED